MKLKPFTFSNRSQRELTNKFIETLLVTPEKWHYAEYPYRYNRFSSLGMALKIAGIPLLSDVEARMKYDKLAPCFDFDEEEESFVSLMERYYGWCRVVPWHDMHRPIDFLDRLSLTFHEIGIILKDNY